MTRLLVVLNDVENYHTHRSPVVEGAAGAGYDVHVAVPERSMGEPPSSEATFHTYTLDRKSLNPLREARALWSLKNLISDVDPDIVHPFTIKPVIYGGLAARWLDVPGIVSTITGLGWVFASDSPASRLTQVAVKRAYKSAFAHSDHIVFFQNRDDRSLFVEEGLVDGDATRTVPGSGVDTRRFSPDSDLPDPPVVMLPARMIYDKGVEDFVDAARLCQERGVDARFVLVGESDPGNPNSIPTETLGTWHREGPVDWWGYSDDMPATLNRASIVCLPSRYREGIPKVLIEAAATGRPLVATDAPGCREIVRDGDTGRLVPVGNPEQLATTLQTLVDSLDRLRGMGKRARQVAVEEYDVNRVVEATLEAYRDLAS